MAAPHRIDTHTHILPPDYAAWLKRKSADAGGLPIPDWSVIKVILSHAGGFVPYASHRIAITTSTSNVANGLAQLRSFYYDIALSGSPTALPSLLAAAAPDHILFGTDFPHAPVQVGAAFTSMYEAYSMSDTQRASIDRGAAEQLFPRCANEMSNETR